MCNFTYYRIPQCQSQANRLSLKFTYIFQKKCGYGYTDMANTKQNQINKVCTSVSLLSNMYIGRPRLRFHFHAKTALSTEFPGS